MEQKTLTLLFGTKGQHRQDFPAGFHAAHILLRRFAVGQARQSENIEKFIQTAQKYVSIETLDPYTLRELVQAIYVEAPDKSSGKRRQDIHIKYDGLGFIPPDELMKEETA